MMFGIFPGDAPVEEYDEMVLPSSIVIDHFKEMVNIPLSYWSCEDYKKSWINSLRKGFAKKNHAVLAVSMYDPEVSNFIFTWVLYFEGKAVYIQNKIIFLDECTGFTPDEINSFVGERMTHDEDGQKISEWKTDITSVINFYNSLK